MLEALESIAAAVRISIPDEHRRPIAIVGAGAIVDFAHLPAYAAHGLEVRGIYDLDAARANDVAARHGVGRVYGSLEELLDDDLVDVVDIAVVPWAQPDVLRSVLAAGKHALCQKPFAPDPATAREFVSTAAELGLSVAVNQQLRWDEGLAAAREMVRAGWIGKPTCFTFNVDISTDWSAWGWLMEAPRLEIMYHSIHYLDAVRSVFGEPSTVFSSAARTPGQLPVGETRTISVLNYADGRRAVLHVNHENRVPDQRAEFAIDGEHGGIRGTLGLLYNYPNGRPDTLNVSSRSLPTDGWLPYPVTERWLPDAFAGPMAGLLREIATGEPAPTRAADNVGTIELVHALYDSIDQGIVRSV